VLSKPAPDKARRMVVSPDIFTLRGATSSTVGVGVTVGNGRTEAGSVGRGGVALTVGVSATLESPTSCGSTVALGVGEGVSSAGAIRERTSSGFSDEVVDVSERQLAAPAARMSNAPKHSAPITTSFRVIAGRDMSSDTVWRCCDGIE